ncbi:hypothetical protein [Nostoc sp. CENA543]|uniref:hypothetical protein n=1 Tax=Nostoc sp. CENA543 TaxID=1869241 RepID=UPI001CEF7332|nr:hypothetical protein [Nostoc sp. CENA543]
MTNFGFSHLEGLFTICQNKMTVKAFLAKLRSNISQSVQPLIKMVGTCGEILP